MIDQRFVVRAGIVAAAVLAAYGMGVLPAAAETRGYAQVAQAAGDDKAEIAFWDSIKDSKNPDEYKAYLDTYPKGKFSALARVRMNALKGSQAPAASGSAPSGGAAPAASTSTSSSTDMPRLPGQSGSAASAPAPAAPAAPSASTQAAPAAAPAEPTVTYWTAAKGRVAIYPEPSARSPFIQDEYYVSEQAIKVVEEVPGKRKLPWLKVITPKGKTGYVFSGEARPAGVSASGKPVQSPGIED